MGEFQQYLALFISKQTSCANQQALHFHIFYVGTVYLDHCYLLIQINS